MPELSTQPLTCPTCSRLIAPGAPVYPRDVPRFLGVETQYFCSSECREECASKGELDLTQDYAE